MEQRHPVSVLQELMAKQYKPLPVYQIMDNSKGTNPAFICKVAVAGVVGTATCSSKQMAKKHAAADALNLLGYQNVNKVSYTIPESKEYEAAIISYNAVGKLNEYAAKQKTIAPSYDECGMENNEFKIQCKYKDYFTDGSAPTKKVAKQISAYKMLQHLKNKRTLFIAESPPIHTSKVRNDEDILEKFKKLSVTSMNLSTPVEAVDAKHISIVEEENNTKLVLVEEKHDDKESQASLQNTLDELEKMDVTYNIDVLSKNPFVLLLKLNNEHNTTVVETAETYQEAYLKLFQNALKVVNALSMMKS